MKHFLEKLLRIEKNKVNVKNEQASVSRSTNSRYKQYSHVQILVWLVEKVMKESVALGPKMYSYLKDNGCVLKESKGHKEMCYQRRN